MSQSLTKSAVAKCVMDRIALLIPSVQVAWPNKLFTPPNGTWLRYNYIPSGTSSETLGLGGEDELTGIFQIDVSIPTDSGDKKQEQILSAFEAYFVPGKNFTHGGQTVTFTSCDRSPGRMVDGFWRVSLSVSFYSRYFRPNFTITPRAYRDENGLIYIASNDMTHAEILASAATTWPRLIKATDNGKFYAIEANQLGSTATEFGGGGFTINSENELEVVNGADTLWTPLNTR